MANNVIKRTWNQNKMVCIEDLSGMAFQSESGGHTFEISGTNDSGTAVSLSGTVEARFLRADNVKVTIAGTISSGKASVTLTSNCYTVAGRFSLTIFVTSNSQKVAVYSAVGNVAVTDGVSSGTVPPLVTDSIQTGSMTASGDVTVNGVLDVTNRRCEATLSSAGWYRVCKIANIGRGDYSFAIDLNICRQFYYANNEQHSIRLVGISDNFSFVNEDSKSNTQIIKRIRYTRDSNNNGYVDIYYDFSNANIVYCEFAAHGFYPNVYTIESLQAVADSPSGETVLAENTFAANTYYHDNDVTNGVRHIVDRRGDIVTVTIESGGSGINCPAGQYTTVYTLPSELSPSASVYTVADAYGGNNIIGVTIGVNGGIQLYPVLSGTSYYRFTLTYMI